MLSLQIILTYKSSLKYGNQKNSWNVSIHCKTPRVVFVTPSTESRPCEEMEMSVLVTVGQSVLSVWSAEASQWLWGFLHRDSGAPENCRALGESHLSLRMAAAVDMKPAIHQSGVFFRHPLSVDQRKTLGNQASIIRILSVIWTSHWTFNSSLGRSTYAGKVLTVHSFCSILEPADVWLVRPALFDVVLFRECPAVTKILSVQIKEKYFCVQLLAVTCLPFFRALAWCHPQSLLQTYLLPPLWCSNNIHSI